jgi:hypothetical protein
MAIRGWVYVMTNKSMPGLVKIGYSTKDPTARAGKLGSGSPSKYEVVYDVLVDDPQPIEQRVHKILAHKREGKEWFRCGISEAVSEIRTVVGKGAITEKLSDQLDDINLISANVFRTPIDQNSIERQRNRRYSIAKIKEELEQITKGRKQKEGK